MKTDYTQEIKALISGNYEPVHSEAQDTNFTEKKTLSEIHKEVTSVLPGEWIQQADIYEALVELGFKSFLYTTEASTDEETGITTPKSSKMAWFLERIN